MFGVCGSEGGKKLRAESDWQPTLNRPGKNRNLDRLVACQAGALRAIEPSENVAFQDLTPCFKHA